MVTPRTQTIAKLEVCTRRRRALHKLLLSTTGAQTKEFWTALLPATKKWESVLTIARAQQVGWILVQHLKNALNESFIPRKVMVTVGGLTPVWLIIASYHYCRCVLWKTEHNDGQARTSRTSLGQTLVFTALAWQRAISYCTADGLRYKS